MKKYIILTLVLVLVFPAFLSLLFINKPEKNASIQSESTKNIIDKSEIQPTAPKENYDSVLRVLDNGRVIRLPSDDYLIGVVLAEMPSEFEMDALKAQAVVARTYTCKRMTASKHTDADICTDSSCCQAYISVQNYLQNGGTSESVNKVSSAVSATSGQVLIYDDQLIEATYFSCSGGLTEDAAAVWGTDVPYLQSVNSPGEENAVHYTDTVKFKKSEFCTMLGLSNTADLSVDKIDYTDGGGVSFICFGEHKFSGTDFRKILGLRSTAFVISIAGETVTITTKGFGHRVGMSQYGAEAMAVRGENYKSILSHYYPGTELVDGFG